MDDDIMMLDQAMDVDSNVPAVPVTTSADPATTTTMTMTTTTAATTNRNPLRARRNISNPRQSRGRPHEPLKINTSARIHKSHAPTSKTAPSSSHNRQPFNVRADELFKAHSRAVRKQKVARAIADGTFQIPRDTDIVSPGPAPDEYHRAEEQEQEQAQEQEQVRRLDAALVAEALLDPVPGMAFDRAAQPSSALATGSAGMADLVRALEAFQVHLARKGMAVPSERAGALVRGLARDVLRTMMLRPDRPPPGPDGGADAFWAGVARDYPAGKKLRWLAFRVGFADPEGRLRPGLSRDEYVQTVLEALERPGSHPDLVRALRSVISHMPSFIVAKPSTLQALMGHFETARARYLASLKDDAHHGATTPSGNAAPYQADAMDCGEMPRGGRGYDSSDDEEDGHPRVGIVDGRPEDGGQVDEGVPSELGQWFLVNLDRFTASKGGQQQGGGLDADMLSALDLGGAKANL
ncbi:hypothetical protein KVR01_012993 [Diaporthe batatas]|uniref:uncharacterized protein n=1 Tax=Diaporthe batatas TaxID=748121 RepID=UPI001D03F65F|nr:uncharacterized protein KVR01_012993 [Diaporthe batatas]KAG8157285.1 hypothetical protein KVR01_012993 [Diaporthe batatas]